MGYGDDVRWTDASRMTSSPRPPATRLDPRSRPRSRYAAPAAPDDDEVQASERIPNNIGTMGYENGSNAEKQN